MVDVVVEHDYTAVEPDELTIKKGDVIHEVMKMKGGWWEGTLNDKKGMFPDNFVKEIDKDFSISHMRRDTVRMRQCKVLFSYKQDHVDELDLNVGDIIDIICEEEEGWWRGVINGREGVFPSNFVEEIKAGSREDLTEIDKTPTLPPKPSKIVCQVKYSYKAQNDDELTLKEGDLINIVSKDGQDPGWWKGELNGQVGVFPDNFVAILESVERKVSKSESHSLKPSTTTAVRKSLDGKSEIDAAARVPIVPHKKPAIPVKKSPQGANAQGGIFAGLRKKITESTTSSKSYVRHSETKHETKEVEKMVVIESKTTKISDSVDGGASSKGQPELLKITEIKDDHKEETNLENAFDHVERSSMLSDVRATRAKAPGRRPPSVIFKDGEPGVVNGNADHISMDLLTENAPNSRPASMNEHGELAEAKPRVREWEKHKAPWLEEMKLNQAKRTSPSPGSESCKLKLTPDKSGSPESEESKSPLEKSTDLPLSPTLNTPPNIDKNSVVLRTKLPQVSVRPQTLTDNEVHKPDPPKPHSINSNIPVNHHSKAVSKPHLTSKNPNHVGAVGDNSPEAISTEHYIELLQRIERLETILEMQHNMYTASIEELKAKILILENERRHP